MPVKINANDYDYITNILEVNNEESEINVKKTLKVSLEQVNRYELYTSKAINNGVQVRRLLEESLLDKAIEDKKNIEIELGIIGQANTIKMEALSKNESIILRYSDISFEKWYTELERQLKNLIKD